MLGWVQMLGEREHTKQSVEEYVEEEHAWVLCQCTVVGVGHFDMDLVPEDCALCGGLCLWKGVLDWWHIQGSGISTTQRRTLSDIPGSLV